MRADVLSGLGISNASGWLIVEVTVSVCSAGSDVMVMWEIRLDMETGEQ